jgi:hypothetical protein
MDSPHGAPQTAAAFRSRRGSACRHLVTGIHQTGVEGASMRSLKLLVSCVLAAVLAGTALAQTQPVDVAGVKFERQATVGSSKLQLNGAGLRTRFIVKVYAAGLYLPAKATTAAAVLSAPGPKRMHVVMMRDIDGNELGRLFVQGMQKNSSKEEFAKTLPGTIKMGEIFAAKKKLSAGEWFTADFVPGTGTVISINGKTAAEPIPEPEFYAALLRIWLGTQPADESLRDALLGQEPKSTPRPTEP